MQINDDGSVTLDPDEWERVQVGAALSCDLQLAVIAASQLLESRALSDERRRELLGDFLHLTRTFRMQIEEAAAHGLFPAT